VSKINLMLHYYVHFHQARETSIDTVPRRDRSRAKPA
jgi:hypothetical protein